MYGDKDKEASVEPKKKTSKAEDPSGDSLNEVSARIVPNIADLSIPENNTKIISKGRVIKILNPKNAKLSEANSLPHTQKICELKSTFALNKKTSKRKIHVLKKQKINRLLEIDKYITL